MQTNLVVAHTFATEMEAEIAIPAASSALLVSFLGNMARSAKDSFELANRVLHDEEGGSKTSNNKPGSSERSRLARQQSNRAKESSETHSHDLRISQKSASDAAENLTRPTTPAQKR